MDADANGEMTLAFDLEALKQLAQPDAVFTDARQWSRYVGIVSDEPTYAVTNFGRNHRLRQDFFSGPRDREESLEQIKNQFETDRHVYIGADDNLEEMATASGWEYLDVEEAAASADWELGEPESPAEADQFEQRDDWP